MSVSEVEESASIACLSLLPEKSKKRYESSYTLFKNWCQTKNNAAFSETTLLAYFLKKSTTLKSPSSLWCEYSMLKTTIFINENSDISKYPKLRAFLKRKNDGYKPRKSNVFSREEMNQFLGEALETYTGYSFRRTSATLLANTGVEVLALKRHGGWKSSSIAESYVADSLTNKNEMANKILYNKTNTEVAGIPSNQCKSQFLGVIIDNDELSNSDNDSKIINEKGNNHNGYSNIVNNCKNCNITVNINK